MKITTSEKIAQEIQDNSIVATGGFVGIGVAEEILSSIEECFLKNKHPRNLTLFYAAGQGDGKSKGLNHLAYEGLVSTVIGGHWGLSPKLCELALNNKIYGYNLPQGVISHMFRDLASKKKGTISKIGIGTFVDPNLEGGKINKITSDDIVTDIYIDNERYLYYRIPPKIDYAIIRGTYSDENGNISFEKEALTLENLSIAMATKNTGGKVIVQVENIVSNGSLNPKLVSIPGILVDYVVPVKSLESHWQTFGTKYNDAFINSFILSDTPNTQSSTISPREIIARRCSMFLTKNDKIINYGIGMPEGIADVLKQQHQDIYFTPSIEPGAIGGTPASGLDFGASVSPEAIIDQPYQFDFYDGGGIDVTFLGLAQCDQFGNINVSKFGPKIAGCGGFINISQNSKKVIFCGTFSAKNNTKKFLKHVEQITFSANTALLNNQPVYYVTEKAVFQLTTSGIELIEIAPNLNIEKDILEFMEFSPKISKNLKVMDESIFNDTFSLTLK